MEFTGLFNKTKILSRVKYLIILGAILVLLLLSIRFLNSFGASNAQVQGTQAVKSDLIPPKAVKEVNKEFTFPIKDNKGKEVSSIKYLIENAQLQDEIIIKGQKATAVKGRTFLIFNLKITNGHNLAVQINTRDYLRLSTEGSNELLAPDIHNDPVEIQAISTKITRIGFPVDEISKNFKLQIGEIDGTKETFDLNF